MAVTETQLNAMYFLVLNKTYGIDHNVDIYQDYIDIIKPEKNEIDIVGDARSKFQCLTDILKLLIDGNSIEHSIDQIKQSPRWTKMIDSINFYRDIKGDFEGFTKETKKEALKSLDGMVKFKCVMKHVEEFKEMYEIFTVTGGTGLSMYNKLIDFNDRVSESIQKAEDSNMDNAESNIIIGDSGDNLLPVLERTLLKFDKKNKIPSGFTYLDENILNGGFDQTRLYTFAGNSGSGKSTIMLNMLINAATNTNYIGELAKKLKIFIYITLENDLEESLERLYCSRYSQSSLQYRRNISTNKESIDKQIREDFHNFNSRIILKHFPAGSLTSQKIDSLINKLEKENGGEENCKIAAIYVDYLDLLKASSTTKDLRLQLNETTQNLKEIARKYKLPVITATQLNRESYGATSAHKLNATMIAESIGKIFITDFAGLLVKSVDENIVFFKVGKNRSGPIGKPMNFKVNFEHFQFIECKESPKLKENKTKFSGVNKIDNLPEVSTQVFKF